MCDLKNKKYLNKIVDSYNKRTDIEEKENILDRAINCFEENLKEFAKTQIKYEKFNVTRNMPFVLRFPDSADKK